jgi:hypothetical protein
VLAQRHPTSSLVPSRAKQTNLSRKRLQSTLTAFPPSRPVMHQRQTLGPYPGGSSLDNNLLILRLLNIVSAGSFPIETLIPRRFAPATKRRKAIYVTSQVNAWREEQGSETKSLLTMGLQPNSGSTPCRRRFGIRSCIPWRTDHALKRQNFPRYPCPPRRSAVSGTRRD